MFGRGGNKMRRITMYLLGSGMILLMLVACNDTTLTSDWRTPELRSNDPDSAWAVTSTYSWKDENILLGLQNDADRLIILLKTRDRATQMTILRTGLTIWLDPTNKKNKNIGIHYQWEGKAHLLREKKGNGRIPIRSR
jgi:hypothetical protein